MWIKLNGLPIKLQPAVVIWDFEMHPMPVADLWVLPGGRKVTTEQVQRYA